MIYLYTDIVGPNAEPTYVCLQTVSQGVGRRNESCRHEWLFLGALNGHFFIIYITDILQLAHLCSDRLTIIQIEIRTLHLKSNATEILIWHLAVVILCD